MNFTEAVIYTTTYGIEPLTALLIRLGITGFVVEDSADFEAFLQETTPHWDYVDDSLLAKRTQETDLKLYLSDNEQGAQTLRDLRGALAEMKTEDAEHLLGRLEITLSQVREEDWANNWKQYFKPFTVGNRLCIKPSWENCDPNDGRITVEIDPASSFGTGQHHTTKLCLEALDGLICGGETVLDMGCGSGILAAAALLLGAERAVGVDIDQNAVKTAGENVEKNHLLGKFTGYFGNVLREEALRDKIGYGQYDVVLANIVADVIIAMAPDLRRFVKERGKLIVSGIIAPRAEEVLAALRPLFEIDEVKTENDWCAVICTPIQA